MKSRLRASLFPLFTGQHKRSIFKAISVIPKFTLFNADGQINSPQLQGIENLKRAVHSSADEDDEFSELGPPAAEGAGTLLKLVTEKPEVFRRKADPARKVLSGSSLPEESCPSLKDFPNEGRPLPAPHLNLDNHNDVSRFTVNSKSASDFQNSSSITIENVPSIVKLSQLMEAISIFGKISSASMRTIQSRPNKLDCCDVVFESVESSRRAVSAGRITVRSLQLPIRPLHVPATVTIRIKKISSETTDPAIHSVCMSIGSLEGMARAKEDAVVAFYRVKDDFDSQSILKRLNGTVIDNCQWSAHLLPRDSTPVVMTNNEDARLKLGLQISSHLAELKKQIHMKKIYHEDLECLHLAIVHLESHPAVSSTSY